MMAKEMPRPGKRFAALRAEERPESDRTFQLAQWLIARTDRSELPQLISWIEASKPRDLAEILRQLEMFSPPHERGDGSAQPRESYRVDELAPLLGVSVRTIQRRVADGTLKSTKALGVRLISAESVKALFPKG